jgi:hypothetical protein
LLHAQSCQKPSQNLTLKQWSPSLISDRYGCTHMPRPNNPEWFLTW